MTTPIAHTSAAALHAGPFSTCGQSHSIINGHPMAIKGPSPAAALSHLWRGIAGCAEEVAVGGLLDGGAAYRVAQVAERHRGRAHARVDQHILELHIAVKHVEQVEVADGRMKLAHHAAHRRLGQRALALKQLLAVAALDQVEHQRALIRLFKKAAAGREIWMVPDSGEQIALMPHELHEARPRPVRMGTRARSVMALVEKQSGGRQQAIRTPWTCGDRTACKQRAGPFAVRRRRRRTQSCRHRASCAARICHQARHAPLSAWSGVLSLSRKHPDFTHPFWNGSDARL